jgi:Family of unknown function (DUF6421)
LQKLQILWYRLTADGRLSFGIISTVLFDETHSEAWTIRPELAREMQPAHPGDSSYARAAELLRGRGFTVAAKSDGVLAGGALSGVDLLVIAHPSEPEWERTTGLGSPRFSGDELDAIEDFVRGGGGLIVLGETEQDKYGNNVNELLQRFQIRLRNETVQDYEHCAGAPSWVMAELSSHGRGRVGDLLASVSELCFYRATTIETSNGARTLARTSPSASTPGEALLVTSEVGAGRVVVLADSDLFGDDCLGEFDHATLWENLAFWAGRPERGLGARRAEQAGIPAGWNALKDATNELALMQAPDGSLAAGDAGPLVDQIVPLLQQMGLPEAAEDLLAWRAGGYRKPDFTTALAAFRPELGREDGRLHLAFLPMYKQNGSLDTCFEAVLMRVPWPEWIAELEASKFDNPKFVPVELVDATRGYDSECAVLFPEMVATAERPVNNFGAIFCDRESARLRRVAGAACDLLSVNLPPDAAAMLASVSISQQAYILWDLIHDRAHSHGELPFDPFMIRQRAPYWMYSLEELRCDLAAFVSAAELEQSGVRFARYVQYSILLDRLLRFPITGGRVRNYDGLGGQLLFAYLRRAGVLRWEDNRLSVDWAGVGGAVASLRLEIEQLYRAGIDRTKLQHWAAAHDLIAQYVAPATDSKWVAGVRSFAELEDPRPYCDEVLADEFPLSIFYSALKAKLA